MNSRRGFTMVEMMMGLVLTMMVGGVVYELLLKNQRVNRVQTEHVGLQENVRAGTLIIANELREVGYDSIPPAAVATLVAGVAPPTLGSTDILIAEAGRLRYKAMRGLGFLCSLAGNTAVVTASTVVGIRAPAIGDSVSIYVEGDNDTSSDDAWVDAAITGLPNQNCPSGAPGIAMTLAYPAWLNAGWSAQVLTGAPVRLYDIMQLQPVVSNGQTWLGIQSMTANEQLQPVVGPIVDSTAAEPGLEFTYLDRDGNVAATLSAIRTVQVAVRGLTDQATRSSGHFQLDTLALTTRVALRNTLRP